MNYIFRPVAGSSFKMTSAQVADWFLDVHANWFVDPANDLYGRREEARTALIGYLVDDLMPNQFFLPQYICAKFATECGQWFVKEDPGMVEQVVCDVLRERRIFTEQVRHHKEFIIKDWKRLLGQLVDVLRGGMPPEEFYERMVKIAALSVAGGEWLKDQEASGKW